MTADQLLNEIERLCPTDRLWLEMRLAESSDDEDEKEIEAMRAIARERAIDQAAIDQAVYRRRYGS